MPPVVSLGDGSSKELLQSLGIVVCDFTCHAKRSHAGCIGHELITPPPERIRMGLDVCHIRSQDGKATSPESPLVIWQTLDRGGAKQGRQIDSDPEVSDLILGFFIALSHSLGMRSNQLDEVARRKRGLLLEHRIKGRGFGAVVWKLRADLRPFQIMGGERKFRWDTKSNS